MITFEEFDACSNKAYKATSNCGGIEIVVNDTGDTEHSRLCRDWQEIKFTAKGRGYFFMHGRKEYIDTFMRK